MAAANLLTYPGDRWRVRFEPDFAPCFCVTVDTEEDFDWSAPFSRTGFRLDSVSALAECQRYFSGHGVAPTYLIDWPIAECDPACAILGPAAEAGACDIGVQLHPWVNPPFDEAVNTANSYAGNLPAALEREKLMRLRDLIAERYGVRPTIYRAGRYGVGPATAATLIELGFACDTSVRSGFNYRRQGGPNFAGMPLAPWWVDSQCALLELPLTTVFSGWLRRGARSAFDLLAHGQSPIISMLARSRALERLALTPEGIPARRAIDAIDIALDVGLPVLNFSFHSPSLVPGNTPYVQSAEDVLAFYRWWDAVISHLARRGVAPRAISDIIASAQRVR